MIFEKPFALMLVFVSLFIIWFSFLRKGRGGKLEAALSRGGNGGSAGINRGSRGSAFIRGSCLFSLAVSFTLISISLAVPGLTDKKTRYVSGGSEYFIVLDVSPSMAVSENGKTRLEKAKETAAIVAESSGNDYAGLVFFSSRAVAALLPTSDRSEFADRLGSARIMDLGDATALGTAIGTALYHLRESGNGKRIVVISDGGSNAGQLLPSDAAAMALEFGVRINCIALGSPSSAARDVIIETGESSSVSGKVTGSYNPEILEKIASETGGYFLENPPEVTVAAFASVTGGNRGRSESFTVNRDLSIFFLVPGVILLLAAMVIRVFYLKEIMP